MVKRLDTYLTLNVLKVFILTESAGIVLMVVIEFFEKMETFTSSAGSFGLSIVYLLLRSPANINLILPLAFLISMLVVLVLMIRGNEMMAIRTSGISTLSLMRPLIGLALVLVAGSFIFSEWVVPASSNAAEYIYRIRIKKEQESVFFKNDRIWFKKDNTINNIDFFDPKKDTIRGLTVLELSPDHLIRKRIDAESGKWEEGRWVFSNVTERTFDKDGIVARKTIARAAGLIQQPPVLFKVVQKNPEDMGYRELSKHIRKLKRNGHDTQKYLVDLYNKVAFPFINLIMVFAALSVGLRYTRTKHISKGIVSGLSLGVLYWFFHSVALSLGYSEIFPPVFAAWFSNIFFFCAGVLGIVSLKT